MDILHILNCLGQVNASFIQVLYLGRAPRTKETLPDFREKCRVTRHSRVFRGLTGSQRTSGLGRHTKSPPQRAAELKRKKSKPKVDKNKDSLLSNTVLAAGAVSSILKDSVLGRSKGLPVDEALALSLQGVASVSL